MTKPKGADALVERLRTDAAYCVSRVGASVRQIGRDCAEAADLIETLLTRLSQADALVAEARTAEGAIPGSEFVSGPCRATVEADIARIDALLEQHGTEEGEQA